MDIKCIRYEAVDKNVCIWLNRPEGFIVKKEFYPIIKLQA